MFDPTNPLMLDQLARRFGALADPVRLRLMLALKSGEQPVGALSAELGVAQPSVSKHLALLREAGLVEVRRAGNQAFYQVTDQSVFEMCKYVCQGVVRHLKQRQKQIQAALPASSR